MASRGSGRNAGGFSSFSTGLFVTENGDSRSSEWEQLNVCPTVECAIVEFKSALAACIGRDAFPFLTDLGLGSCKCLINEAGTNRRQFISHIGSKQRIEV